MTITIPVFEPNEVLGILAPRENGYPLEVRLFRVGLDGKSIEPDGGEPIKELDIASMPEPETPELTSKPIEDESIEILGLSSRAFNVLDREDIHTVGDLLDFYHERGSNGLLDLHRMGMKGHDEVIGKINDVRNGLIHT